MLWTCQRAILNGKEDERETWPQRKQWHYLTFLKGAFAENWCTWCHINQVSKEWYSQLLAVLLNTILLQVLELFHNIDITTLSECNKVWSTFLHTNTSQIHVCSEQILHTIIPLPIVYSRSQFLRLCWYQLAGNSLFWARSPWLCHHCWKLALVEISSFSSSKLCSEAACRINEDESNKTFFKS